MTKFLRFLILKVDIYRLKGSRFSHAVISPVIFLSHIR